MPKRALMFVVVLAVAGIVVTVGRPAPGPPPTQELTLAEPSPDQVDAAAATATTAAPSRIECDVDVFGITGLGPDPADLVAVLEQAARPACRPGTDVEPLCATMFLIGATDPVAAVALGFGPDLVDRLVIVHTELLGEAIEMARRSSDEALAMAIDSVLRLDVEAARASGAAMAEFVVARGAPAIVEPVRRAEQQCS